MASFPEKCRQCYHIDVSVSAKLGVIPVYWSNHNLLEQKISSIIFCFFYCFFLMGERAALGPGCGRPGEGGGGVGGVLGVGLGGRIIFFRSIKYSLMKMGAK